MSTISQENDANGKVSPFYTPLNITGTVSTQVKTGATFLHTITFNKPVATGVITIADVAAGTATTVYGTITVPASPQPVTLQYDVEFPNGLAIVVGTAAQDITVSYL